MSDNFYLEFLSFFMEIVLKSSLIIGLGFYYRKSKERQRIVEIFQIKGVVCDYIIGDVKYFLFFWMNSIASSHYLADSLYYYNMKYE